MVRASFKHWVLLCLIGLLVLTTQFGCDSQVGQGTSVSASASTSAQLRVVSLTPAITQMLIDMGKREQVVGVSQYDDTSLGLPVCGTYQQPVVARIVELSPDVVLTESPGGRLDEVPALLRSLADEELFELKVIPHSRSIMDVQRALIDADVGLGAAVGDPAAAERARRLMALRIKLVGDVLEGVKRPRVLMLISPATLGSIGTGVTHDELLELAGGANALSHIDVGYITLDRAKLQQTVRPEVVLIFEPGGVELGDGDGRLRAFEGLSIPVNDSRRFAVIDHPQAMLPSTSLPEIMLEMALVLHPDKAAAIREAYDAAGLIMQQEQASPAGDRP